MKAVKYVLCWFVGAYAYTLLFETQRGDDVLRTVDRVLFPDWLTGEKRHGDES